MLERTIAVLGGGAAGTAAARTLARRGFDGRVLLIGETGVPPYNRTLVDKGVLTGLLTTEQAALPPVDGVQRLLDTVLDVDTSASTARLASGAEIRFDAAIVATGSRPRRLDSAGPGLTSAVAAGRVRTLHSADDAQTIRGRLAAGPRRVAVLGAGFIGAEAASLLREAGHEVVLIARSRTPLLPILGRTVATHVVGLHREHVATRFGRSVTGFEAHQDQVDLILDDGETIESDLVIVAHGTIPSAPGGVAAGGLTVDDRLRHDRGAAVYAAGGVALHRRHGGPSIRIDHWDDAAAQGVHAARSLLHVFGDGGDPGPYRPSSRYSMRIYGATIAGTGIAVPHGVERTVSEDPLLTVFETPEGVPTGAVGVNAARQVYEWNGLLDPPPPRA